jgi:hypothetical protein
MRKVLAPFILGFMLALIVLLPLRAQTPDSAPADTKPTVANPVPAGQAPAMKRIPDLVHAGKYAEAGELTTGLLLAYPNDQRPDHHLRRSNIGHIVIRVGNVKIECLADLCLRQAANSVKVDDSNRRNLIRRLPQNQQGEKC